MTGSASAQGYEVSPKALVWARSRASLSHQDVARFLRRRTVDAETVKSWEQGTGRPSPAQVRSLAKMFRVPARWLYYDEPPREFDDVGIVDFRTHDGSSLKKLSLNLRGAIEHSLAVQAWVADHRSRNGQGKVELVGACSPRDSVGSVAAFIRHTLGIEQLRTAAADAREFLNGIRQKLEELGVLVFRMGQVANKTAWSLDPEEFKGFTLIDEEQLAPLVFINRKDIDEAQLFTLGHELAHLVTGGSGVSNEDIGNLDEERPDIERFCDAVSEELLVPSDLFKEAWGASARLDQRRLEHVATQLRVTSLIAGRRVVSLNGGPLRSFQRLVRSQRERAAETKKGGTVYVTMPAWYGRGLVQLMASAATSGAPFGNDALELLGVKFDTASRLAQPKQKPKPVLPPMDEFPLVEISDSWRSQRE